MKIKKKLSVHFQFQFSSMYHHSTLSLSLTISSQNCLALITQFAFSPSSILDPILSNVNSSWSVLSNPAIPESNILDDILSGVRSSSPSIRYTSVSIFRSPAALRGVRLPAASGPVPFVRVERGVLEVRVGETGVSSGRIGTYCFVRCTRGGPWVRASVPERSMPSKYCLEGKKGVR